MSNVTSWALIRKDCSYSLSRDYSLSRTSHTGFYLVTKIEADRIRLTPDLIQNDPIDCQITLGFPTNSDAAGKEPLTLF